MKKWIVRTVFAGGGVLLLVMLGLGIVQWLYPEPRVQGRALSQWVMQLRDGSPAKRQEAAEALRSMGPEAIPYLTGELTSAPNIFQRAAKGASKYAPGFLKRPLQRIENAGRGVVNKHMALEAIGLLGTNGAAAAPAVGEVLRQPDVGLVSAAATALIRLGTNSLPELIAALDDGSYDTRAHACFALAALGKEAAPAVPRLGQIVLDERGAIAAAAAMTLARIGEPAVPVLTGFLGHTNVAVRKCGAVSLAYVNCQPMSAIPRLIKAAQDANAEVRAAAVQAIGMIDRSSPESAAALLGGLDDPNPEVRLAVARAVVVRPRLVRENPERFYPLLEDQDEKVRATAAAAVGQTGQHGAAAIPKLEKLLGDPNAEVRQSAERALSTITNSMELVKARGLPPGN